MLKINVKDYQNIDKALKALKRKFDKTKVVKEFRKRMAFEKPSDKRRNEIKKAVYTDKKKNT